MSVGRIDRDFSQFAACHADPSGDVVHSGRDVNGSYIDTAQCGKADVLKAVREIELRYAAVVKSRILNIQKCFGEHHFLQLSSCVKRRVTDCFNPCADINRSDPAAVESEIPDLFHRISRTLVLRRTGDVEIGDIARIGGDAGQRQ